MTRPDGQSNCAEMYNHGTHWSLRIQIGEKTYNDPTLLIREDESPRDAAVREITALGWKVAGDGSWWVAAFTGPDANRTWAYLSPAG